MIRSRNRQANAALAVAIRIWIVSLAILAIPAAGIAIVGLAQCKDAACASAGSQSARYIAR